MPAFAVGPSLVKEVPAAPPAEAVTHFAGLLALETDCWDVHADLSAGRPAFVGHIAGAVNLPHRRIVERNLASYPADTLFVVYCAGPQCNGADRAALRLARLGRAVKKMIGGVEGWKDDGFTLTPAEAPSIPTREA